MCVCKAHKLSESIIDSIGLSVSRESWNLLANGR